MRVREYRSFASIESGLIFPEGRRARVKYYKLEIEAKSSILSSPNVITSLFTGRSSKTVEPGRLPSVIPVFMTQE
jgi:hypothetical protein